LLFMPTLNNKLILEDNLLLPKTSLSLYFSRLDKSCDKFIFCSWQKLHAFIYICLAQLINE
jgi:hypothetical protein